MAILAGLLGFVGRFAGKVLTTTLGWASTLLFGRVPGNRQIVLALITFGSVVWAALAIGVVLPYVGAFLVAAVPAPGIVSEDMLRLGMLIGALVVPAVVGVASIFVVEPANRPKGAGLIAQVLRGYPLSAALAVTLVLLALVGIARFVHHLALRWTDAHVAVVIRPGGYERVVADLERALDDAGLAVDRRPAPAVLAVPGRLLGSIAGPGVRSLVPESLVQLAGDGLEVGLYPSDIAISGDKVRVARARAAIASRLVATAAWMTTTAEAQEIEARLERLARRAIGRRGARCRVCQRRPERAGRRGRRAALDRRGPGDPRGPARRVGDPLSGTAPGRARSARRFAARGVIPRRRPQDAGTGWEWAAAASRCAARLAARGHRRRRLRPDGGGCRPGSC